MGNASTARAGIAPVGIAAIIAVMIIVGVLLYLFAQTQQAPDVSAPENAVQPVGSDELRFPTADDGSAVAPDPASAEAYDRCVAQCREKERGPLNATPGTGPTEGGSSEGFNACVASCGQG